MLTLLPLAACAQIVTYSNDTLSAGESVEGNVLFPAANVALDEGSTIDGTAIVFCCNLDAQGEITEDLFVVSGNVSLGPQATFGGDLNLVEGNLSTAPTADIQGAIQAGIPARLVLATLALLCAVLVVPLALGVLLLTRRRRPKGKDLTGLRRPVRS